MICYCANVCTAYITHLTQKKYQRTKTISKFALDLNQWTKFRD